VNRGPRDHPEAIIYMSRATPRKKERGGRLVRLTAGGLVSGRPSARRDHGPDGPDGPEGIEDLSLRPRAPSRASGGGSPVSAAGLAPRVGTVSLDGPDTDFGGTPAGARLGRPPAPPAWSRRALALKRWGACAVEGPTGRSARHREPPLERVGYGRGSSSIVESDGGKNCALLQRVFSFSFVQG
jgi:hypothetical protein